MITAIDNARLSSSIGTLGGSQRQLTPAANPDDSQGFEQQLFQALSNSLSRLGPAGGKLQVDVQETGRRDSAGASSMRQFLVTVTPVLVPSTASTTTAAPVVSPVVGPVVGKIHILRTSEVAPDSMERLPPIASNNLSVHDYEDPVPELVGILQKMGVNTAGMTFELYDDVIENLGGHYTNHLIRADLGNGKKEDFSVEWTLRNPKVTAVEIARLSKMSSAQG